MLRRTRAKCSIRVMFSFSWRAFMTSCETEETISYWCVYRKQAAVGNTPLTRLPPPPTRQILKLVMPLILIISPEYLLSECFFHFNPRESSFTYFFKSMRSWCHLGSYMSGSVALFHHAYIWRATYVVKREIMKFTCFFFVCNGKWLMYLQCKDSKLYHETLQHCL